MEVERGLGFEPVDCEQEKRGYDIESRVPGEGKLRFIEVKGRAAGADTLTVTRNEILYSLNSPTISFWLWWNSCPKTNTGLDTSDSLSASSQISELPVSIMTSPNSWRGPRSRASAPAGILQENTA